MKDKIIEAHVLELFPQIVSMFKVETKLNSKQLKLINKYSEDCYKNDGNTTSTNSFILNLPAFKNLKKELLKRVELHCYEILKINKKAKPFITQSWLNYTQLELHCYGILKINKKVKPFITQSWLNYTQQNQFHHQHAHPNSFLSGAYYISCDNDSIHFFNLDYNQIEPVCDTYTRYNSSQWTHSTNTHDLFIFKSGLSHSVKMKPNNATRISLAFNVFLKGEIGTARHLTYLKV